MSKHDYDEKDLGKRDEKDEKDLNKREEKTAEEKWERDRLSALTWAAILIWAGVVLLAGNLGAFDLISRFMERLPFGLGEGPIGFGFFPIETWAIFWLGAAAILLIQIIIRLLVPEYRRPVTGSLILVIVFLGMGIGRWECIFPLILIAAGVGLLLRNLGGKDGKE